MSDDIHGAASIRVHGPATLDYLWPGYWDHPLDQSVEYVRADIVDAEIEHLRAEVAELRERLRWRDLRTELPPEDERYLILYMTRAGRRARPFIGDYVLHEGWSGVQAGADIVTHWLPIPADPSQQEGS
jgi:hypothetical protein